MQRIYIDRLRRTRLALGVVFLLIVGVSIWQDSPEVDFAHNPGVYVFGVLGLLFLGYRNYIEIDPVRRRLSRRVGFLYAFALRTFDVEKLRRVTLGMILHPSDDDDTSETKTYTVRVSGAAGGLLCELSNLWAARRVAERVARALALDLETKLFGGSSVRAADELDLPLAERWSRAGLFKKAPESGASSGLETSYGTDASEIDCPVDPMPRLAIGLGASGILAVLIWLYTLDIVPLLMLLIFGGAVIFFGGGFIAQHTGRNRLRFTATEVQFIRGLSPLRPRMPLARIEEMIVSNREIALLGDSDYLVIDRPREPADKIVQLQFIERQIARRHPALSRAMAADAS